MTKEKNQEIMVEEGAEKKSFFAKNWKWLACGGGVIALAAAFFCAKKFYFTPKAEADAVQASAVLYQDYNVYSEPQYAKLAADAQKVASSESGTKAGNTANLYAAIGYYNEGKYAEATKALEAYEACGSDIIDPAATAALGNCYACQKQYDKAVAKLVEAAEKSNSNAYSPIYYVQAGEIYELQLNDKAKALECYKKAKSYKAGIYEQNGTIDAYIERASAK